MTQPECGFAVEGCPHVTCSEPRGHTGPHQFIRVPEPPVPPDMDAGLSGFLPDVAKAIRSAREALHAAERCCDTCHASVSDALRPWLAALRARPVEPPPNRCPECGWILRSEKPNCGCRLPQRPVERTPFNPRDWIDPEMTDAEKRELLGVEPPPPSEPPKCADCGTALGDGEAKVFTVCEGCWNRAYRRGSVPPLSDPKPEKPQ